MNARVTLRFAPVECFSLAAVGDRTLAAAAIGLGFLPCARLSAAVVGYG